MRCLDRAGARPARHRTACRPYTSPTRRGAASLSFEVLWSRLLAMALGTTVPIPFGARARHVSAGLGDRRRGRSVCCTATPPTAVVVRSASVVDRGRRQLDRGVGAAAFPFWFAQFDEHSVSAPWLLTMTNLFQAFVVVFPGTLSGACPSVSPWRIWAGTLGDPPSPGPPVRRDYDAIGAVIGSLATSFVLIPLYGSSAGPPHLL